MKIRNNLQLRFVLSFTMFALLIIAIYLIVMNVYKNQVAEEFFQRRIQAELEYFSDRYQLDANTPLPIAEDIHSFLGMEKMPNYIRSAVERLQDGVYDWEMEHDRFFDDSRDSRRRRRTRHEDDLFFGIKTLHDGKKIFVFIDFDFWSQQEHKLTAHTFWSYLVALIVALVLGWFTANRVINPLKQLMVLVENSDPDNMPSGFAKVFKEDEIGALAKTFEGSMARIKKFIKREHQFTRDASHELRTPVTVIKGAVELLKMSPACEDNMTDKLVKRIERSTWDMETTIESLLWLARENTEDQTSHLSKLLPIVETAIEQNKHLIAGKPVEIKLEVEAEPVLSMPPGMISIAISNLVRNACQYTAQGSVIVRVKTDRIEVEDTGMGIKNEDVDKVLSPGYSHDESKGFGFGLDIVKRLCDRMKWILEIDNSAEQGLLVSLIFEKSNDG